MQARLLTVGMALVVGCGTPVVVQDMNQAAADQDQQQAAARSADQLALAYELPGTPPDVAAAFVTLEGEGGEVAAEDACLLFNGPTAAQFAAVQEAPTCVAAMLRLQAQVTDPNTYISSLAVPDTAWTQTGDTATVNGCALSWTGLFTDTPVTQPGPAPGLLVLTRLDDYGWQITSYEPC